jgi:hypothetical protein
LSAAAATLRSLKPPEHTASRRYRGPPTTIPQSELKEFAPFWCNL